MDKGIRLTLAPKSIRAFLKDLSPIVHGIVTDPRSLFLTGIFIPCKIALHVSVRIIGSLSIVRFFEMISFMNFAYVGICSSASKNGIFSSSFLNISRNFSKFFSCCSFFLFLVGKGSLTAGLGVATFSLTTLSSPMTSFLYYLILFDLHIYFNQHIFFIRVFLMCFLRFIAPCCHSVHMIIVSRIRNPGTW